MQGDSPASSRLNKTAPIYVSRKKNGVHKTQKGSPLGMKSREEVDFEESRVTSRKNVARKSSKSRSRAKDVAEASLLNGQRGRDNRDLNVTSVSRSRSRKRSASRTKRTTSRPSHQQIEIDNH